MGGRGSGGGRGGGRSGGGGGGITQKETDKLDSKEKEKKIMTKKKELSPEEQKKLKAEELKKKRLAALEKARAKRAENLKNGIKPEKKPRKTKAKMSMDDTVYDLKSELLSKVKTDGYLRRSDFRVQDDGSTINVSIRDLGKWKNPSDARYEEDYDWQELHSSSRKQIDKVVTRLQKRSGRKISWGASEKNWIDFDIEKKKGE
jgi:hypothetical protein